MPLNVLNDQLEITSHMIQFSLPLYLSAFLFATFCAKKSHYYVHTICTWLKYYHVSSSHRVSDDMKFYVLQLTNRSNRLHTFNWSNEIHRMRDGMSERKREGEGEMWSANVYVPQRKNAFRKLDATVRCHWIFVVSIGNLIKRSISCGLHESMPNRIGMIHGASSDFHSTIFFRDLHLLSHRSCNCKA